MTSHRTSDSPEVDVVIAVHSATRPIYRAAASVLEHTIAPVRVIVVVHNIDAEPIQDNLAEYSDDPRVAIITHRDGIASPAGPMNAGFSYSSAPYVTLLGSDDALAPGAIDSWLTLAMSTGATAVVPRITVSGRGSTPFPPTRRGRRTRALSARLDRLAYRTAPLGLLAHEHLAGLRFTEGIASGEDIAFSAQLWFTGHDIVIDRDGPAYTCYEDAVDRVTSTERTVGADFAFLEAIEGASWFTELRRSDRTAIVVKLLRIHFMDAVVSRALSKGGIGAHREDLRRVLKRLTTMAPGALKLLSRVDHRIIDAAFSPSPDPTEISILAHDRWNRRSFGAILTPNPLLSLHSQAMLRLILAANAAARDDR